MIQPLRITGTVDMPHFPLLASNYPAKGPRAKGQCVVVSRSPGEYLGALSRRGSKQNFTASSFIRVDPRGVDPRGLTSTGK